MDIHIHVEKKHLFLILGTIMILGILFFVGAYNSPPLPWAGQ